MQMTDRRLRAAVIGVGYLGNFHVDKYHALEGVDLVGVVDIDPRRAEEIAAKHGVRACNHHAEILPDVDLVSVVVPSDRHYAIARDCLEAGVHILVEKPVTQTVGEATELIDLANRKGCVFQVGHLERFNPAIVSIRDRLGKPMFIESHRLSTFRTRGTEVNVVLDLMIHDIDILLSLVDSPITMLRPIGLPVLSDGVDIANVRIEFESGCVANLTASRVSQQPMRKMRVFQPDAYFSIDLLAHEVAIFRKNENERDANGVPRIDIEHRKLERGDALLTEIGAFVSAVRTRSDPVVSGEDGRRALEVALEINKSL